MEQTEVFTTKNNIRQYWSKKAKSYDQSFGHGVNSLKEKELWIDLLSRYVGNKNHKIIDIGCGTGFLSLLLAEN